jgi:hypothetical protein
VPITLTGPTAEIWWGYHRAAVLTRWTCTRDAFGGTVSGTLENRDDFRLAQSPLTVVIPVSNPPGTLRPDEARGPWRWPLTHVEVTGSTFTAKVLS